jgi:UDP-glucose-4-epimerase GalE
MLQKSMSSLAKILLIGGGGFVGAHVSKLLREQKIDHLVVDDFSTGHVRQLGESPFVRADIAHADSIDATFAAYTPDTVIHLAALATLGDCAARPEAAARVNIEGTRNLLAAMVKHNVRDMVFASSCAVYNATQTGIRLNETIALNPGSIYGQTKLAGEQLLAEYREKHGLRSVAFRIFNAAGADPDGMIGEDHTPETHLLPLAIDTALGRRNTIDIFGNDYATSDGTAVRDYVHVCDIASAFLLGAGYLKNGGAPIALNLGSGIGTSVRELLQAVEKHTDRKIRVVETPRRAGDAPWLVADPTLIKRTLPWQPQLSTLDQIIATALHWHRGLRPE